MVMDQMDWQNALIVAFPGELKSGLSEKFIPPMEILGIVSESARNGGKEPFIVFKGTLVWSLRGQKWNVQYLAEGTEAKN